MDFKIFDYLIEQNDNFPNNLKLPLLLYKQVFDSAALDAEFIKKNFKWSWLDKFLG